VIDDEQSEKLLKTWRARAWDYLVQAKEGLELTLQRIGSWPAPPAKRDYERDDPPDPDALKPGWSEWGKKRRMKGGP
jgi:hypothetical protein